MLPDKRKLRKCLESYREPPKAVLSYYRDKNDVSEYAVMMMSISIRRICRKYSRIISNTPKQLNFSLRIIRSGSRTIYIGWM